MTTNYMAFNWEIRPPMVTHEQTLRERREELTRLQTVFRLGILYPPPSSERTPPNEEWEGTDGNMYQNRYINGEWVAFPAISYGKWNSKGRRKIVYSQTDQISASSGRRLMGIRDECVSSWD